MLTQKELKNKTRVVIDEPGIPQIHGLHGCIMGVGTLPDVGNFQTFIFMPDAAQDERKFEYSCFCVPNTIIRLEGNEYEMLQMR